MAEINDKNLVITNVKQDSEIILVSYDEDFNQVFNIGYTWSKFNDNWRNHLDVIGMWKTKTT